MYGDYPGASVGKPVLGYSIMRVSIGYCTIDCLTKYSSLGIVNDTLKLSGTLKGHIYDSNNRLVRGLKVIGGMVPCQFILEIPLTIDSTGTYSTKIFQTICSPSKLLVQFEDSFIDSVAIEPFELQNIHPDTVVLQDIHLKDDKYILASVNNELLPINDEITIMNYPNPFNISTIFFTKIPDKFKKKVVEISIINVTGQFVRNLQVKEDRSATWDGRDSYGNIMPSGAYFYRLNIDKQAMKSGSMILLK